MKTTITYLTIIALFLLTSCSEQDSCEMSGGCWDPTYGCLDCGGITGPGPGPHPGPGNGTGTQTSQPREGIVYYDPSLGEPSVEYIGDVWLYDLSGVLYQYDQTATVQCREYTLHAQWYDAVKCAGRLGQYAVGKVEARQTSSSGKWDIWQTGVLTTTVCY